MVIGVLKLNNLEVLNLNHCVSKVKNNLMQHWFLDKEGKCIVATDNKKMIKLTSPKDADNDFWDSLEKSMLIDPIKIKKDEEIQLTNNEAIIYKDGNYVREEVYGVETGIDYLEYHKVINGLNPQNNKKPNCRLKSEHLPVGIEACELTFKGTIAPIICAIDKKLTRMSWFYLIAPED